LSKTLSLSAESRNSRSCFSSGRGRCGKCVSCRYVNQGRYGVLGRMDATAVCTLVHKKEITRQIDADFEQGLSQFVSDVDSSSLLDCGHRADKLRRCRKCSEFEQSLELVFERHSMSLLERWRRCRTMAWHIFYPETGLIKIQSNSCRLRFCPMCGDARVSIIAHSCSEFFQKQSFVRFLTLTLKHSDLSLAEQIRRMKKCYIKLSRRVGWKKYVTGSVAFLHVKWNENTGWHVHLHILLTGSYLPQKWLSEEWFKVTGDSLVVHVQAAHSDKELGQAIKDFTRYAGCPANLLKIPAEYQVETIRAFEGIRVCWATGICRDVSLSPPKYKEGDAQGINLGRDSTIRMRAKEGDFNALRILFCSAKRVPYYKISPENPASFRDDDDFIDDKFLGLSEVEPDEWVERERPPPGGNLFDYEGDVFNKNAPW